MNPVRSLLRAAVLVGAVSLLAACTSKEERLASSLRKGAELIRTSDWDKAGVEVRNVLQIDPRNARAHLMGAQIAEGQRDIRRAYLNYVKAVELDANLLDAKVGLARLYVFAGEHAKAQPLIDDTLKAEANHAGALTIRAALIAQRGDMRSAVEQAQQILAGSKKPPAEASMLLAALFVNQGEAVRAAEVVDAALKTEPGNTALLQVAAQIAGEPKAPADVARRAPEFYRRATELTPGDTGNWNLWAAYHLRRGEADEAESVLRKAVQAMPDDGNRVMNLAELVAARRGVGAALQELRTGIEKRPRDSELRFGLIAMLRADNRADEAQQVLNEIIRQAPEAPAAIRARGELASIRLAAGQEAEARTLIAEVLKANPRDAAVLTLRARMALKEGRARDAIADLRSALRDQPGAAEASSLLARAHAVAGELDLARDVVNDALKLRPEDVDLRLLLAGILADMKNTTASITEIDAAIYRRPQLARLYEFKAALLLGQGTPAAAERTFVEMKAQPGLQAMGHLRLGQFQVQQRRLDDALKTFDAGLKLAPDSPALTLAAIGVLAQQQKFADVDRRVESMLKADPKSALAYQIRGESSLMRKDYVAAQAAFNSAIEVAPGQPAGYLGAARALGARSDISAALGILQRGMAANPKDNTLAAARADWLTRAARWDEATKAYEDLLARAPSDEIVNNLAYLLAEVKGDPASLQRASTLMARFNQSTNPVYLDSLGWIHHKLGEHAKAVPLLERAVALQPQSALYASHLGIALMKAGEVARGQEMLKKLVAAKADLPNLEEVRRLAGTH